MNQLIKISTEVCCNNFDGQYIPNLPIASMNWEKLNVKYYNRLARLKTHVSLLHAELNQYHKCGCKFRCSLGDPIAQ